MTERYHFIGIGGIGMSALGTILVQRGCRVSGSDLKTSDITRALQKQGVVIYEGHAAHHVPKEKTTVVYSTAVLKDNPELLWAKKHGYTLLHRSELLAQLLKTQQPLCVAGTHGKTTTSALLAHVMVESGSDPSYAIGGMVATLRGNGKSGKGLFFVAEADESDGSFLKARCMGSIVTNIEPDHIDYWKSEENLLKGFEKYFSIVSSAKHCFWCFEDDHLRTLNPKGVSYGFSKEADLTIQNYTQVDWKLLFDLHFDGKTYEDVEIPLIGAHNVLNSSAVFGLALRLNVSESDIRKAFLSFRGIARRMEKKGEAGAVPIFDDYAHHPTEIFATLRAVKVACPSKRLVVVFQPHRYTRTKECLDQFAEAFQHADHVILTDIYAAGETPVVGVSSEKLLKIMQAYGSYTTEFIPRSELSNGLQVRLEVNDLLITMGAGDVTQVGPELIALKKVKI